MWILAKIITEITRKPRQKVIVGVDFNWDSRRWVHNCFRLWEVFFWRKSGIRKEAIHFVESNTYKFFTLEAFLGHWEQKIRSFFPKYAPLRVYVPRLITPDGRIFYTSPYLFAIAFGATLSNNGANTNATYTSISVSGSNTLGIVYTVGDSGSDAVTAITWNLAAMSKIGAAQTPGDRWSSAWYVVNPASATTIAIVGASFHRTVESYYTGCAQTGQVDASNTGTSTSSTSISVAITVVASSCWAVMCQKDGQGGKTYSASGSLSSVRYNVDDGGISVGDSNTEVSTGSNTCTLTASGSSDHAGVAFSIVPVAGAAATIVNRNFNLIGVGT